MEFKKESKILTLEILRSKSNQTIHLKLTKRCALMNLARAILDLGISIKNIFLVYSEKALKVQPRTSQTAYRSSV